MLVAFEKNREILVLRDLEKTGTKYFSNILKSKCTEDKQQENNRENSVT